jgi:hypothetical protein
MKLRNGLNCACTAALVVLAAFTTEARDIAKDPTADRALKVEDMVCAVMVVPQDPKETVTKAVMSTSKKGVDVIKRGVLDILGGTKQKIDVEAGKEELDAAYRMELKRGNWLPMSAEVEYGRRSHQLMADTILDRDSKLGQELYPRADALLDEIKRGIDGSHDYDFKVFIREESSLNAMALPGGFLYLDVGLVKDPKQHDKARFALAHEIGHVLQRHETRELQGLIVDSYKDGKALQAAVASSRHGRDETVALLKEVKISKDTYVRHTLDQELQADACGARLIFNAYPGGKELSASAAAFISSLPSAKAPVAPASPEFPAVLHEIVKAPADRHPTSEERTKHLRTVQASLVMPGTTPTG